MPAERALVLWGGYPGHQPREAVERFIPYLSGAGFDVIVKDSLDAYADTELMSSVRVILQNWTTGDLTMDQFQGLSAAVQGGAGLVIISIALGVATLVSTRILNKCLEDAAHDPMAFLD